MQYSVNITDKIWWLGANDRRKELFENLWPLPNGVSYNSYLIKDEKNVLMDTIESGSDRAFLDRIEKILDGADLHYLVINHMELDHSGEIETIVRRFPDIQIVGNSKTFKVLEAYYGDICKNLLEVKDGDTIDLGSQKLTFYMTPMVHWPETMMTYESTQQILFSGDAFGTFGTLDGGILDKHVKFEYYEDDMRRYYSNIVGKYGAMVQKALGKLSGVPIKTICSLHGPVWQGNVAKVVGLYDRWSRCEADPKAVMIVYGSMYGNTAKMADYIANQIAMHDVGDIRVYDASKTHVSYLISEAWRCKNIILGSCAYNTEMFPTVENFCREMEHYGLKDRILGIFGTYSWSGGGVRNLKAFAERIGWETVGDPTEIMGRPDSNKYTLCNTLCDAIAEKIKNS